MSHAPYILIAVGNRPHFIKLAPVVRACQEAGVPFRLLHTGQHSDNNMSQQFFDQLDIPKPDIVLVSQGRSHGAMTASILHDSEEIMLRDTPAGVLVFGDTNSTLAVALAAKKLGLWVGHVEAGPRMQHAKLTNPEEINRAIVDRISSVNFCGDQDSVANLTRENLAPSIEFVGDVMLDSFLQFRDRAIALDGPGAQAARRFPDGFIFSTFHRAENVPLGDHDAAVRLAKFLQTTPLPMLLALHPRTRRALDEAGLLHEVITCERLHVIEPTGYLETLQALQLCRFVASDSGGLQKEAYFSGKRVAFYLNDTPWQPLAKAGWVKCFGEIAAGAGWEGVTEWAMAPPPPRMPADAFGDGSAGRLIAQRLLTVTGGAGNGLNEEGHLSPPLAS
jgi:UDP-N-acetylglucosamine 2-epimerase